MSRYIWTGTRSDGTWSGIGCLNWTSSAIEWSGTNGYSRTQTSVWTNISTIQCNNPLHLFCFQQS